MTVEEFNQINWHRGNIVRLTNGKEYPVKKTRKNWLILYSVEYHQFFIVNHTYVAERVSDNVLPTRGEMIREREAEIQKAIDEGRPIPDLPPIPGVYIQSDASTRLRKREDKESVKAKAAIKAKAMAMAKAQESPYGYQRSASYNTENFNPFQKNGDSDKKRPYTRVASSDDNNRPYSRVESTDCNEPIVNAQSGEDSAPAKPKRKRIVMRKPVVAVERVTPRNDQDDNK